MSKFSTSVGADYWMTTAGSKLAVGFNMPAALTGDAEHQLPPYAARRGYLVDKYPACPPDWLRSTGRISSFFVPIQTGRGMWLDFNECDNHANHVAIVVSVQGVNAVTGLPCNDAHLEQYLDKCPKHKKEFGHGRFCPDCNFKWPKQNYVCTTGTPSGSLWLDGFRAADGAVRQYILTQEKARGVANAVIGEARVFAVGVSFFLSKDPRPPRPVPQVRYLCAGGGPKFGWGGGGMKGMMNVGDNTADFMDTASIMHVSTPDMMTYCSTLIPSGPIGVEGPAGPEGPEGVAGDPGLYSAGRPVVRTKISKQMESRKFGNISATVASSKGRLIGAVRAVAPISVTKVEVGAGAKIRQHVHDDPQDLAYWRDEPEAILVINYALEEDCERIFAGGTADVEGSKEGFLHSVPVGN